MSGSDVRDALYGRHKYAGEPVRLDTYEATVSTEKMLEVEKGAADAREAWEKVVYQARPKMGWKLVRTAAS